MDDQGKALIQTGLLAIQVESVVATRIMFAPLCRMRLPIWNQESASPVLRTSGLDL